MSQQTTADLDRLSEIVKTAALVIHKQGYAATSMNDIADAVNLTKAGLYYYTRGKQDLLYMIVKWAMDLVETEILQPCGEIEAPEERLHAIVHNHLEAIRCHSKFETWKALKVESMTLPFYMKSWSISGRREMSRSRDSHAINPCRRTE